MELDTCRRTKAGVVLVVANNAAWNIERQDQLVNYAGRLAGVDLADCDYAGMARAMGIHAEHIDDAAALPGALEKAFKQAPALLDVTITRDAVSADFRSGIAAVPDLQALSRWHDQELKLKKKGI
jgi:acetolactate synthase-1/2/3 large subunit